MRHPIVHDTITTPDGATASLPRYAGAASFHARLEAHTTWPTTFAARGISSELRLAEVHQILEVVS